MVVGYQVHRLSSYAKGFSLDCMIGKGLSINAARHVAHNLYYSHFITPHYGSPLLRLLK